MGGAPTWWQSEEILKSGSRVTDTCGMRIRTASYLALVVMVASVVGGCTTSTSAPTPTTLRISPHAKPLGPRGACGADGTCVTPTTTTMVVPVSSVDPITPTTPTTIYVEDPGKHDNRVINETTLPVTT